MRTFLRVVLQLVVSILLFGVLWINVGLYYSPSYTTSGHSKINADVLAELRFLRSALRHGAAEDMQQLFPEGYVFLNALYGLSWCEIASRVKDRRSDLYQEAHTEIQYAYDRIASDSGRSIFSEYQVLPYGAFYNGWCNYLLGKKLSIEGSTRRSSAEVARYKARCDDIVNALDAQQSPYLTSYPGAAWPADMVVCMASISDYDRLFPPLYRSDIDRWIMKVRSTLDTCGLIPHQVHPQSGDVVEQSRGCSQSLMLCFLPAIDTTFSREQYSIYRALFLDHRFGLAGVREYPHGDFGFGDVDSGPIFLQMGSAASIVGIRALRVNKDISESVVLRNSLEPFALPFRMGDTKRYLLGQLPVADAFLTWAQAAGQIDDRLDHQAWRVRFHGYSAAIGVLLIAGYVICRRRLKQKTC